MFGKLTYAPHMMFVKKLKKRFDEYGNYLGSDDTLQYVCRCRCDDAGVNDAVTVNGELFHPSYHIVAERGVDNGSRVVVKDCAGKVRAEGKVVRTSKSNYFKMFEAWI